MKVVFCLSLSVDATAFAVKMRMYTRSDTHSDTHACTHVEGRDTFLLHYHRHHRHHVPACLRRSPFVVMSAVVSVGEPDV